MRPEDNDDGAAEASADAEVPYEVGYRKPPRHSQFKKGQSGNARGRTKGELNSRTYLTKALNQKVMVKEQGRSRAITKREAMFTQLANNAVARGNLASIKLILTLEREFERQKGAGLAVQPDAPTPQELKETQEEKELTAIYANMTNEELEMAYEVEKIKDRLRGLPAPEPEQGPFPLPPTGRKKT
jgi:hypothetical protein